MILVLKRTNEEFSVESGLNSFYFENKEYYRNVLYSLEEEISLIDHSNLISFSKCLVIKNILDIDLNDKKNVGFLYKLLTKKIKSEHYDDFKSVVSNFYKLFDDLLFEVDLPVEFNEEDITKLLQSFDFKFKSSNNYYVSALSDYFRTSMLINNFNAIMTFNLTNMLTNNEIFLLNEELKKSQIAVIDFDVFAGNNLPNKIIVIDDDLCII